jgi:hypothetical protein
MRAADDSKINMYCTGNPHAFGYHTEVQSETASLKKPAGSHTYFASVISLDRYEIICRFMYFIDNYSANI